ncbi:uncharacterized protein EDB93DRAFT_605623 [Suillus bovinus]|uniref:uncharacterized protein n=1 Tax=Suillus bovinus TaxID=48563 RepID=UPI001B87B116|nr:uncharacterized protein EDB93DRAFT_85179 [Suillus bovinus]XP_041305892.1 uncharacterized protein EDB93DRAFT_605623 [Suillus bovinus]KAG2130174.1 hypothetical protein EDB93DRAFT_85179 [Suillus bovinus]KAG2142811.1 hypothetical protein EDB93DRAFT_605623 [Suillus bovinus]
MLRLLYASMMLIPTILCSLKYRFGHSVGQPDRWPSTSLHLATDINALASIVHRNAYAESAPSARMVRRLIDSFDQEEHLHSGCSLSLVGSVQVLSKVEPLCN